MWLLANRRICVLMHGVGPKVFGWMKWCTEVDRLETEFSYHFTVKT